MKLHVLFASVFVAMLIAEASGADAATSKDWKIYIEAVVTGARAARDQAAGEALPPGVSDVASALNASPDIVKQGLRSWLQTKMQSAALADDMTAMDRYQAFFACLANNDCARVQAMTRRSDDFGPTRAGDTESGGGTIQVEAGTYGGNCKQPRGNVTGDLAHACNGQETCDYKVDYTKIGDPAFGCAKDYVAEWSCGSASHSAHAAAEAGYGSVVTLSCR